MEKIYSHENDGTQKIYCHAKLRIKAVCLHFGNKYNKNNDNQCPILMPYMQTKPCTSYI